MIKQIDRNELLNSFFDLIAEVEFGNHFDSNNAGHSDLLNQYIDRHISNGGQIWKEGETRMDKRIPHVHSVEKRNPDKI